MLSIKLTGVQKAMDKMKLDPEDVRQAMAESGLLMEGDAKQICTDLDAVDTGRFRASISTALDGDSQKDNDSVIPPPSDPSAIVVLRIGSNVEYAIFIILGTKKMAGRDCLTPAVYMNIGDIEARIRAKIRQ